MRLKYWRWRDERHREIKRFALGNVPLWIEGDSQRRQTTKPCSNPWGRPSVSKVYLNCSQQRHFINYCPNLGAQIAQSTVSQLVNQPYRLNEHGEGLSGVKGPRRIISQEKVCAMT